MSTTKLVNLRDFVKEIKGRTSKVETEGLNRFIKKFNVSIAAEIPASQGGFVKFITQEEAERIRSDFKKFKEAQDNRTAARLGREVKKTDDVSVALAVIIQGLMDLQNAVVWQSAKIQSLCSELGIESKQ